MKVPQTFMLNKFTTDSVQRMITYLYTGKVHLPVRHTAAAVLEFEKLLAKYEMLESLPNKMKETLSHVKQMIKELTQPNPKKKSEAQSVPISDYPLPCGVIQVPFEGFMDNVGKSQVLGHYEASQPVATEEYSAVLDGMSNIIKTEDEEFVADREIKEEPVETTVTDYNMDIEIPLTTEPNITVKEEMNDVTNIRNVDRKGSKESIIEITDKTNDTIRYFCDLCFYHSTNKGAITVHQKKNHRLTQCKVCESGLYRVVGKKGKKRQVVFQCTTCHKCCKTQTSLHKHTKQHQRNMRYYKLLLNQDKLICVECKKLFPNQTILQKHKKTHVEGYQANPKVPCETCGKLLLAHSMKVKKRIDL